MINRLMELGSSTKVSSGMFPLTMAIVVLSTFALQSAVPQIPQLDWPGKRSDWINVKTDVTPAAKGDGVTDDAPALQAALTKISETAGMAKTVYLPPGTYRITSTLTITQHPFSQIVGHGRATTILWDGATGTSTRMFISNGAPYSMYQGIIWDGNNKAGVAIYHDSKNLFETEIDNRDMVFKNLTSAGLAVAGTNIVQASAEMSVVNCVFDNCATGLSYPAWNDYDNLVIGCYFNNCGTGISCGKGQGYFRDSHFEGSKTVDFYINDAPEHPCSIRRCTSNNSQKFLSWTGGVSTIHIQECHVSGWKNTGGAITLSGPPTVVFDCRFTNPPSTAAPIQTSSQLVLSNNTSAGTTKVYGPTTNVTEIPAGKLSGTIQSATQMFFKETFSVPQKIYDVKAFGALGNGSANDYAAIQRAIDSARTHGQGAIAYLPRGTYKVNTPLLITGANYVVGGSGFQSLITWGGASGGITMRVINPQNVTLQQIAVGYEQATGTNIVDIQQTGTNGNSSMLYDVVSVYGVYRSDPQTRGIQFSNLPVGTKILANHLQGNVRATNASRATILINWVWEGGVTVEGATETVRDGFFGILTRFNSNEPYGLYVKDNQSIVITDYYTESAQRYLSIEGNTSDIAGRVTICGIKVNPTSTPCININNYKGRFSTLSMQYYLTPSPIVHTGTQPVDMFFIANYSYNATISVSAGSGATMNYINNSWSGPANANPSGAAKVADVFDDLRQLGALDLDYNFGSGFSVPVSVVGGGNNQLFKSAIESVQGADGSSLFNCRGEYLGKTSSVQLKNSVVPGPLARGVYLVKANSKSGNLVRKVAVTGE